MPVPFSVIGGFLGAGKTTAINAILTHAINRRMAVLVNDFGGLAIDAALIAERSATAISLTNGCVCCSLVGGLVQALLDVLALDLPPDHILIEASGVSDPGRIAQIARADPCLSPDATIVLVAADQWTALSTDRYVGDTVVTQLAAADFLVLNKVDLVNSADVNAIRLQLSALAPRARLLETVGARLPYEILLGNAIDSGSESVHASGAGVSHTTLVADDDHAQRFFTRIFRCDRPIPADRLRYALDRLPPAVLRAKGFVRLDEAPEEWCLIQAVGSRWTLTAMRPRAPGDRSELVVMGLANALGEADLSALAAAFGTTPSPVNGCQALRTETARRGR